MRNRTVEVVDDFHPRPDRVRQLPADAEWMRLDATGEGALRTRRCYPSDEATNGLTALLGRAPEFEAGTDAFGFYTFVPADSTTRIEAETGSADLAAVLYLAPPHLCAGGISFLRETPTGTPEVTMQVAVRFNRLVLFRPGRVLHRAGAGFGAEPSHGRLAQVFLFN
ncbi:hypothetical protein [Kitasatospora sp. NPDC056731]|uniref:hypothetical protein n=1 Tax=Kitasatospora sp. NPDC056731 TaxID=3155422 RepID=UPI0034211670